MNEATIVFCIVASVFAVASLIYVTGSIISQRGKRKEAPRKQAIVCAEQTLSTKAYAWLILGSIVGTAGGVLAACATARSHTSKRR